MKLSYIVTAAALASLVAGTSFAGSRDRNGGDDFYGTVESMPTAQSQAWVIGGKTFNVDQRTKIKARKDRKIEVGSCVKVEGDLDRAGEFFISEIELKKPSRCQSLGQVKDQVKKEVGGFVQQVTQPQK